MGVFPFALFVLLSSPSEVLPSLAFFFLSYLLALLIFNEDIEWFKLREELLRSLFILNIFKIQKKMKFLRIKKKTEWNLFCTDLGIRGIFDWLLELRHIMHCSGILWNASSFCYLVNALLYGTCIWHLFCTSCLFGLSLLVNVV